MRNPFLKKNANRLLLYTGLCLLLISLVIRSRYGSAPFWIPIFSLAILFKAVFLVLTLRSRQFKWSLWLGLIITGVIMIFISMLFKYIFPVPLVRDILFYGAITLKLSGLILLLSQRLLAKRKVR